MISNVENISKRPHSILLLYTEIVFCNLLLVLYQLIHCLYARCTRHTSQVLKDADNYVYKQPFSLNRMNILLFPLCFNGCKAQQILSLNL